MSAVVNNRKNHAMRARIDELLAAGWSISGRDPVRIDSGRGFAYIVRGGALIRA